MATEIGATYVNLVVSFVLCHFILVKSQDPGLYEVVTVDQCYSKPIPVRCDPGFMVRVLSAKHRQTVKCKSGFQDSSCMKEERGNPACVGNTTCVFTTPWMYLSSSCGYSNNFEIEYQCIPANIQQDICATPVVQGQSGFLTTPNYPKKYPVSKNCTTTIKVHPLHRIKVYILDLFLAYYTAKGERLCRDKLWLEDADGMRLSEEICAGHERAIVFVSTTNEAVVRFVSAENEVKNAKGFWLSYEAFDPEQEDPVGSTPHAITRTTTQAPTTTSIPTTNEATSPTPWYFKYTNENIKKQGNQNSTTEPLGGTTEKPGILSANGKKQTKSDTGPKKSMRHRIYGIVKEESNWARKTIDLSAMTTQVMVKAVGKSSGKPRPKVSRRKYLKTPQFSRNLNDLIGGQVIGGNKATNKTQTQSAIAGSKQHTLEAKKPSWIDALGKEYIAAISTGAGCLIILLGVICGLIANIKRKRKLNPPSLPVSIKKPYNNVILAYTGADRPTPGVPNLGFDGDQEGPKEVNGFSNPHFKADAPWLQLSGLLPIDEIPENLYTEVKQCDIDPESVIAKAQFILGRSKSKSMDDLRLKKSIKKRKVEKLPQNQTAPGAMANLPHTSPALNPLTVSLDSLDCGSQISCPSTVEFAEEEHGQEYYETIEDMYRDIALATMRANQQLFNERLDSISLQSTPRSSRSAGAALMSGAVCIDTPYEDSLLDHADVHL